MGRLHRVASTEHRTHKLKPLRVGLFLALTSFVATASAATDVRVSRSAVIEAKTEELLSVLATEDLCEKGCRYSSPGVVKERKLAYKASDEHYYKWTHVGGIKTVKFFKEVRITSSGGVTRVKLRALTAPQDQALISELEKKTGLEHSPSFDAATGDYKFREKDGKLHVQVQTMTRISGVLTLLEGTVKSAMKESLNAIFANFEKAS